MPQSEILDRLWEVILERKRERPNDSYVVSLLDGGLDAIAAKLREESEELIEAAARSDSADVAHECADLLFHAWVLLASVDVPPERVRDELGRRFGVGGHAEKAARGGGSSC